MENDDKVLKYMLIGMFIVLLAFGGFVLFKDSDAQVLDNYKYGNGNTVFEINKVNDIESYITILIGDDETLYTIGLRNDPLSLEDIPVEGTLNTRIYNAEQIYITINPFANLTARTTVAALEINNIIDNEKLYGIPVRSAMTQPYSDYPVKSCYDATSEEPVIFLTLGSETIVYTDEYCIVVVGTDEDEIIRAADRLVLTLLGVMK
ncbi:MAG: hypothetical protein Q8Q35_04550 [Nanoarchaeota archaeon]|nr:hypothetical protein [Nanoarchaeota archaeon]